MSSIPNFILNIQELHLDPHFLALDLDVRAMHLELMHLSWNEAKPGVLQWTSKHIIKHFKITEADWNNRIYHQLHHFWDISEKTVSSPFVIDLYKKTSISKKRKDASAKRWQPDPVSDFLPFPHELFIISNPTGFSLDACLNDSELFSTHTTSSLERSNIWQIGLSLITENLQDSHQIQKSRAFLGKLIREFGEQEVSYVISSLSLKPVPIAESKSYLSAMLKNRSKKKSSSGGVVL